MHVAKNNPYNSKAMSTNNISSMLVYNISVFFLLLLCSLVPSKNWDPREDSCVKDVNIQTLFKCSKYNDELAYSRWFYCDIPEVKGQLANHTIAWKTSTNQWTIKYSSFIYSQATVLWLDPYPPPFPWEPKSISMLELAPSSIALAGTFLFCRLTKYVRTSLHSVISSHTMHTHAL